MIIAFLTLVAALVLIGCTIVFLDAAPPLPHEAPPELRPVSMRVVFVAMHDQVVIDGLLDIPPSPTGVPTTWALAVPGDPMVAAVILGTFERWADDGAPVAVDLSRTGRSHGSVVFSRDDTTVRLAVLPKGVRQESSSD